MEENNEKLGKFSGTGHTWGAFPGYSGSYEPRPEQRYVVDKRTHRIRFEDESESQVTVVIEPK